MTFPASHTFTMKIPFGDNPEIKVEVEGCYEDEYQFSIESVTSDETGEDITEDLSEIAIERINEKGCEDYPEFLMCIAETRAERMMDR